MSRNIPTPKARAIARQLLACEAGAGDPPETNTPAAFRVTEKLCRHLGRLIGIAGFRTLYARALTLAKAQVPVLGSVQIKLDGSLDSLHDLGDEKQTVEASVELVAQLLALLITFVGEDITLSLVHHVWPDFVVPDRGTSEK